MSYLIIQRHPEKHRRVVAATPACGRGYTCVRVGLHPRAVAATPACGSSHTRIYLAIGYKSRKKYHMADESRGRNCMR